MKKMFKSALCLAASLLISTSAFAAPVELYALDGRTLQVEEEQVGIYTAEGMGWYTEKPVTMFAADGRTLVVPADKVEAHKLVGWSLQAPDNITVPEPEAPAEPAPAPVVKPEEIKVSIRYTDGTVVKVPSYQLETYKSLGWTAVDSTVPEMPPVASGPMSVFSYDGAEMQIDASQLQSYKAQGWYPSYEEAVYSRAAYGIGAETPGATALIGQKSYEAAFLLVQEALDKIESSGSEYVNLLYQLRDTVTDSWSTAANSPLGFVNYWFSEKDGKKIVVFEYRNVSNSRIQYFKINFNICNAAGEVIETNTGSYYVENLQMAPCEKKRVAWVIESKDPASIKDLKVNEVIYSDGTKWNAAG